MKVTTLLFSICFLTIIGCSLCYSLLPKFDRYDVKHLTFYGDKQTTSNRGKFYDQIVCTGVFCDRVPRQQKIDCTQFQPGRWVCEGSPYDRYEFDQTDVICEGYDGPDDTRFAVQGSCNVEYNLKEKRLSEMCNGAICPGLSDRIVSSTPSVKQETNTTTFISQMLNYIFFLAIIAVAAVVATLIVTSCNEQPSEKNSTEPVQMHHGWFRGYSRWYNPRSQPHTNLSIVTNLNTFPAERTNFKSIPTPTPETEVPDSIPKSSYSPPIPSSQIDPNISFGQSRTRFFSSPSDISQSPNLGTGNSSTRSSSPPSVISQSPNLGTGKSSTRSSSPPKIKKSTGFGSSSTRSFSSSKSSGSSSSKNTGSGNR